MAGLPRDPHALRYKLRKRISLGETLKLETVTDKQWPSAADPTSDQLWPNMAGTPLLFQDEEGDRKYSA